VLSAGSCPAIAPSTSAASVTSLVSGPIWSSDDAYATSPYRLTRPYVGFSPTIPHRLAGWRTLPPVSEPSAARHRSAATAAALPPLDPPGTRVVSHGLRVVKYAEFSVLEPIANSSVLVLPSSTAPASTSRFTAVAW
jgi:hypothetical protein